MNTFLQIIKNRNQILEGAKNFIFRTEHVEEVYNNRLEICKACPEIDNKGDNCAVTGTQPCCSQCGCSLSIKLRSLSSSCPLSKWTAILSDVEEVAVKNQINQQTQDNV
jgi:hypothetical protein